MKRLHPLLITTLTALAIFSVKGQNYSGPKMSMDSIFQFKLENGLEVAIVEEHRSPTVLFRLYLNPDSLIDNRVANVVAGSLAIPDSDSSFQYTIDSLGARFVSLADGLLLQAMSTDTDTISALLANRLIKNRFGSDKLGLVQSSFDPQPNHSMVTPPQVANNLTHRIIKNNFKSDTTSLDSLNCVHYYRRAYTPTSSLLVVVGDVQPDSLKKILPRHFGKWKQIATDSVTFKRNDNKPILKPRKVHLVDNKELPEAYVKISFPFQLADSLPKDHELELINLFLAGYSGSAINQNLRVENGFSYGMISNLVMGEPLNYFTIQGGVKRSSIDSALWQVFYEVNKMKRTPIDEKRLRLGKKLLKTRFLKRTEKPDQIAAMVFRQLRDSVPKDYFAHFPDSIQNIKPLDLLRTANKYLMPDSAIVVIVGDRREISSRVKAIAIDSTVHYFNPEGFPMNYSKLAEDPNMTVDKVLKRYLDTISVSTKIDSLQTLRAEWTGEFEGATVKMTVQSKKPDQLFVEMSMDGILISATKLNGDSIQLQNSGLLRDSIFAEQLKLQSAIIPEKLYQGTDYQVELNGKEFIDQSAAHRLKIVGPGMEIYEFYEVSSGLKLATTKKVETASAFTSFSQYFSDYREVGGILLPHRTKLVGVFPEPLDFKLTSVELDGQLEDTIFILNE